VIEIEAEAEAGTIVGKEWNGAPLLLA